MNYQPILQLSDEWWNAKVGKISGTRFGQLISGRDNMLIDELANEILDGYIFRDDFESEEMAFGNENEPVAIDEYEAIIGLKFDRGGVILSELNPNIHMASPDGITADRKIIVEVKCTTSGKLQISRFRRGIDKDKLPQVINYFAVAPEVEEVHWVSYCPFRQEIPIVSYIFKRDTVIEEKTYVKKPPEIITIQDRVNEGLALIPKLESDLLVLIDAIKF